MSCIGIKRVMDAKQTHPAVFEVTVRLDDGKAATVALSVTAFNELMQHGARLFPARTAT